MLSDVATRPRKHPVARRSRRQRRSAGIWPRVWHFLSFGAPGVLIYVCFVLVPILVSFGYSLTNYNPFRVNTRFVGLQNYKTMLSDDAFLTSLRITTILTVIVVIVPNVVGLGIAVLLDRRGWFYNALRSVFFTPMVLSSVVISVLWRRMLQDDGPINDFLRAVGVHDPPGWLSDPDIAIYSIALI